jgi:hypothetical protein
MLFRRPMLALLANLNAPPVLIVKKLKQVQINYQKLNLNASFEYHTMLNYEYFDGAESKFAWLQRFECRQIAR